MATTKLLTAEDLWEISEPGEHELLRGELRSMPPVGGEHAEIGTNLVTMLWTFVSARQLGRVYTPDAGFILARHPDIVLSPDAAFVREDRLPPREQRRRFLSLSPDLAVEILSPSNDPERISEKAQLYLAHGTQLVWIVDPRTRTVTARSASDTAVRHPDDTLDGGVVLPGFRVRVARLFD